MLIKEPIKTNNSFSVFLWSFFFLGAGIFLKKLIPDGNLLEPFAFIAGAILVFDLFLTYILPKYIPKYFIKRNLTKKEHATILLRTGLFILIIIVSIGALFFTLLGLVGLSVMENESSGFYSPDNTTINPNAFYDAALFLPPAILIMMLLGMILIFDESIMKFTIKKKKVD